MPNIEYSVITSDVIKSFDYLFFPTPLEYLYISGTIYLVQCICIFYIDILKLYHHPAFANTASKSDYKTLFPAKLVVSIFTRQGQNLSELPSQKYIFPSFIAI